jgi:hypothetical protein
MTDEIAGAFDGAPLTVTRKTGQERFHNGAGVCDFDLVDFWRWSASDLVSNTWRGVVAEYIVARALGIAEGLRNDWRAYDLETPDGVKVEVKSSAYVQTWKQNSHSRIEFGIGKRSAWDAETNKLGDEARRHADVYVFALLHYKHRQSIDPLDLAQWEFYVVPTRHLNERHPEQEKIGLTSVQKLAGKTVTFDDLEMAVRHAGSSSQISGGAAG